jgi:hypothetical protein
MIVSNCLETVGLLLGSQGIVRACSAIDDSANWHSERIPQILILASQLIEKPPPIGGFIETTGSRQLAEPPVNEFLRIERHRLTGAALSQPCVTQHGDGRWIEAEKMQPPAVWPVTLQAIEESAVAIVQQTLTEVLPIAAQSDLQNLAVEVE